VHRPLTGSKGANEKKYGSIKVLAEEIASEAGNSMRLRISGVNLPSKDWLGKGDKYLVFKRQRGDGKWEIVHKTEVSPQPSTLNPQPSTLKRKNETLIMELKKAQNDRTKPRSLMSSGED
jgi:hypothetical protein